MKRPHSLDSLVRFSLATACALLADTSFAGGYHGAVGRNLVLNPDFELGGTGWRYNCSWPNTTEEYLKTERAQSSEIVAGLGVDGGDCLRLGGPSSPVVSYCFPVEKGRTYTVTVHARALPDRKSGDLGVLVIDPDWQVPLWKKQGGIPGEWTRYSWTFTWTRSCAQKRAYVNLGSSTGLLVDRVMVAEGDDPAYEAPVMAGLAFARWPYFVRGRDTAEAVLRVAPGTRTQGRIQLATVARDAWGMKVWKRDDDVALDGRWEVKLALPTARLGNVHVELTATQDGEVVGRGVSRYAVMDPPTKMKQAPGRPGLFGMCQSTFAWPSWANTLYAPVLVDTGVQFNRFFAKSRKGLTHPFPKEYIEGLQRRAKPLADAGIALMACVQGFPGMDHVGQISRDPNAEEIAAYERGLRDYVQALAPHVKYWEIFNEPDLWRAQDGKRAFSPEKYAIIQKSAFKTIKALDPELTVVCNALNTFRWSWMDGWFKAGGIAAMDSFSFHPYRSHPDQLNEVGVYADILRARDMLDAGGGRRLGLINSEQLYGVNLFYTGTQSGEASRGYYVDTHHELEAASRTVRNLIHHGAAGATCCPFTFRGDFAALGPGPDGMLVYDMLPAYNAATRFLANAGRGRPLPLGADLRAFLFPEAVGGALVAVWTPVSDIHATMTLAGDYVVYDIMGNPRPKSTAARTLRLATDPVYLRYPAGTSAAAIEQAFAAARTVGLSDPVSLSTAISAPGTLAVRVANRLGQPVSGTVRLTQWPDGWTPERTAARFSDIPAKQSALVAFPFSAMPLASDEAYAIAVVAETAEGGAELQQQIRPLFIPRLAARPKSVGDWPDAAFIALGADHLSKRFGSAGDPRGAGDLSARVAVGWTPDALHIRAEIADDQHRPERNPAQLYLGDSLQLYFDIRNDARPAARNDDDDVEYAFALQTDGSVVRWLEKGAEGHFKGEANQRDKLLDPDVQAAITRNGATTVYAITLPRDTCLPGLDLAAGTSFGFSLLINDNDGDGRKTGLTLSPKGTEPYGAPTDYRDAVLAP